MDIKKRNSCIAGVLATLILIIADQAAKYWAKTVILPVRGMPVIPGVFHFYYLENRGAAFGMLDGRQWIFLVITFVMVFAAGYVYYHLPLQKEYRLMQIICVLIAAGAIGNAIDRVVHRYVIDFLYFILINFPVFNVADCYVCIGAGLMIIGIFTVYKDEDFSFLKR